MHARPENTAATSTTSAAQRRKSVALLYPGDRAARERSDPAESRLAALFSAFDAAGMAAQPAVYHDDFADEVAAQLLRVDAVLVWCNPIEGGRRRETLDAMLRDVARSGVFVSTHPDTILRLGSVPLPVLESQVRAYIAEAGIVASGVPAAAGASR